MNRNRRGATRGAGAVLCLLSSVAWSQDVHKCVADGRVTYQAAPCARGDTVLHLHPSAPTASEAAAAAARAQADRDAAASAPAGELARAAGGDGGAASAGESCPSLARQYGEALENRDLLDRQPFRATLSPANNARDETRRQIQGLEARMRASSCGVGRP